MKKAAFFLLTFTLTGCVGFGVPHPLQGKPYTLIRGGDQLGRDQLTNRRIVAAKKEVLIGRNPNEVLTFLGQPQEIAVRERNTSEDGYFVYYREYIPYVTQNYITSKVPVPQQLERAEFVVRFYHEQVIDIVRLD